MLVVQLLHAPMENLEEMEFSAARSCMQYLAAQHQRRPEPLSPESLHVNNKFTPFNGRKQVGMRYLK